MSCVNMLAQLYALAPLSRDLRGTFELPEDPYADDSEARDQAIAYLSSLGVFFYRDEEFSNGVVITPDSGEDILDREGFIGYKYLVDLDPDSLRVLEWPDSTSRDARDRIRREGDNFAWMIWQQPRRIRRVTEGAVYAS